MRYLTYIKHIYRPLVLALILVGTTSCGEDFLVEEPPHILSPETLFRSADGFQAGVTGLYALVRQERSGNRRGSTNDLMSGQTILGTDIAYGNWTSNVERIYNELGTRNNPQQSHFRRVWTWLYEIVNSANTVINRADGADIDWTEEEKNRIVGEARFFRAYAYRHLSYLWGDVPINLNEAGEVIRADWVRNPITEVRQQIIEDLRFAEMHLPDVAEIEGRISKVVAQHFLAEMYLATGQNDLALEKAQAAVDNPNYSLITERYGVNASLPGVPFMDMFAEGNSNRSSGNTEALWTLQLEPEVIGGEGHNIMRRWYVNRYWSLDVGGTNPIEISEENGGRGLGRIAPTRFAMDLYEPSDHRGGEFAWRLYWIVNHSDASQIPLGFFVGDTVFMDWRSQPNEGDRLSEWPSTRKWDSPNPLDVTASRQYNDQVFLRLADTYLLLAEAQFKTGNTQGAATTINTLRTRANASPISSADIDLDFILDERARELWSEEHRRYTLLRTDTYVDRTVLHNSRTGPVLDPSRDVLLPIPQDVIDANTDLDMPQNPGY